MHLRITQIEETVSQAGILVGRGGRNDLEGQVVFALAEDRQRIGGDLYHTCRDLLVDGILVALDDLAGYRDGALAVDAVEHRVVMYDDLGHAVLVADIEEHYAAVVADILHPTGKTDFLPYMILSQISAGDGAINVCFHLFIFLSETIQG